MEVLRKIKLMIELIILEKSMSILFHLPIDASTKYLEYLKNKKGMEPETLNALAAYHKSAIELKKRINIETNSEGSLREAHLHDEVPHSSD